MKNFLYRLPLFLCFLLAVAFSVKNLREPDLWWQIRTGQWILQNHRVPTHDVFSYTFSGANWINIKWGFEVLAALISAAAGPQSIFLLQAIVICCIVFFLAKFVPRANGRATLTGSLAAVMALLLTLIAVEYRIIGRPEMFSHLFTVVFLYLLWQYRKQPSYKILMLVPLQVFWVNFHEAYAIGIIITGIFCAGAWLEYYLGQRKIISLGVHKPVKITMALVAVIASVAVNPYGTVLLARPFSIMNQVYQNKFTTELAGFNAHEFWQWNTYYTTGVLLAGLAGIIFYFAALKTKTNRFKLFVEHFGIGYLLTVIAFIYLAATAYRNIAFLAFIFFPALVFGLNAVISKIPSIQKIFVPALSVIIVLQLCLYGLVVSNKYYQLTGSHDRYGLEMLSTSNPVGAADYVRQNNLTGKCFSDYLTSSYLLWKLQPEFKTFIDLRDLDVFPADFFSTFAEAVTYPDEFEKQDSIWHFNYIVLYRPQFAGLHNYLFNQSRFKLAFLDAVAAVYIPKTAGDSSTIQFTRLKSLSASVFNYTISKLLNPFYQPFNYSSVDYDLLASSYCISVGRLDEAEKYARQSSVNNIENYKGLKMLGDVYYHRIKAAPDPVERGRQLSASLDYFQQSINQKNDYADAWLGEGAAYFEQRNMAKALECFEKCIALDEDNLNAYLSAGSCCSYFLNSNAPRADDYAARAIAFYQKANYLNPNNPSIMLNLGFLYARLNDCDNVVKYFEKIAGFPGFSDEQRRQIRQCLGRCGK